MKINNFLALFLVLVLIAGFNASQALADSATINFETYSTGTVNGQDGWSSTGAYDHKIVDPNSFGITAFGSRSLRISNAVTSGSFGDQTYSKSLVDEAGEASAVSNGLSGGTRQPYFEAQWDFASTVPASEQPGLSVTASPDRGDGARMSWVQMADKPSGLEVNFYDYQESAQPANCDDNDFVLTNLANELDRATKHTIKIQMFFKDGSANDVVSVWVDGQLKHTGTSWEDYFRDCESNPTRPVDSILFRTGGTAAPATLGKGFLIDNLTLFSGSAPTLQCTTLCYVDAVNGNDANDGVTIDNAKKTIQAAIDAVNPGGQVRVLPGDYNETATNRFVLSTNGPHQFGLFIDKAGLMIQGVDGSGNPLTDYDALQAYITTNATNNFGASGIFVQADNVTIAGLHIGPNLPGDNKTLEIIGDGFTLKNSHIDVDGGGSIYFDDWQFDTVNNVSHVKSYTLDHNLIDHSTSLDITSGAGYSGPASGRQIINNKFENADYWPSISFNGSGTGVPWFVQSVGGAVIKGNTFINTFPGNDERAGHIRVRGTVDNNQFGWASYWTDNTFNKAVVTVTGAYPPFNIRNYTYTSGAYTFDTRRIGLNIQGGVDKAQAGDTVLVKDGAYAESPNIDKALTLKSWAGRDVTTIQLQSGPTYLGALTVDAAGTTVIDGFTIKGFDAVGSGLASSNIELTTLPDDVTIRNNRIKVGAIGSGSNGDDGFGLSNYYTESRDITSLKVTNNIFEPLNSAGTRAFYINPGVNNFNFATNQISGKFLRTAITQAKNGTVEVNTLTGTGSAGSRSAGFGTWGYPDPTVYGHTLFRNNTISGVGKGIAVFETNNVTVQNNFFVDTDVATWIGDTEPLNFNPTSISINKNSIVNSSLYGVQKASGSAGTVNAELNWWGSNAAAAVAAKVNGDIDFTPWLCTGVDTSTDPGFQPNLITACFTFTGFSQPIDMNTLNTAKAGQTIPVKWRLTDATGAPISDPSSFVALRTQAGSCNAGEPTDAIETYSGSSGLQYLGDGYWQFNWKTPKNYANTCRTMYVEFQAAFTSPIVDFKFK